MIQRYNIKELLAKRADQRSFHIVAERHVRIEFRNMMAGEQIDPFSYDGEIVITCFSGSIVLAEATATQTLTEMDQVVVMENSRVWIECREAGAIQLIWAPPDGSVTK